MNTHAIDRAAAMTHLRRGHPVLFRGQLISSPKALPAPPTDVDEATAKANPNAAAEAAKPFVATRHSNGSFTRAGLEHIITSGGAVLHQGTVITSVADLPDEATLAGNDSARLEAIHDSIDEQIAKLHSQKMVVQRQLMRSEEEAKEAAIAEKKRLREAEKANAKKKPEGSDSGEKKPEGSEATPPS